MQRAESLMGFFYLLTLYAFIRGTDCGQQREATDPRGGAPKSHPVTSTAKDGVVVGVERYGVRVRNGDEGSNGDSAADGAALTTGRFGPARFRRRCGNGWLIILPWRQPGSFWRRS